MPRLEEKLAKVSAKSKEQLPDEALEVMEGQSRDLRESGKVEEAVGLDDRAPDFRLPATTSDELGMADLRSSGPVILSFYRGRW